METGIEVGGGSSRVRRHWTVNEKLRIVEESLPSDRPMASLAREYDLNANQLFYWRKLYRAGPLCEDQSTERPRSVQLLPISVVDGEPLVAEQIKTSAPRLTMNIEIPGRALVSLEGVIDAMFIRTVLEELRG
jgi:transposase